MKLCRLVNEFGRVFFFDAITTNDKTEIDTTRHNGSTMTPDAALEGYNNSGERTILSSNTLGHTYWHYHG